MGQRQSEVKPLAEELKKSLGEDFIHGWTFLLYEMARSFYEKFQLNGKAYFDEAVFRNCLVDIFLDLKRLSDFHEIQLPAYEKIVAYASSWIIRRKPFQMMEGWASSGQIERYRYINEKFALFLLLRGAGFSDCPVNADLLNRIFYHLIYRDTDSKVLELFLYGINLGRG